MQSQQQCNDQVFSATNDWKDLNSFHGKITSQILFCRMLSRRTYRRPIRASCELEPQAGSTAPRFSVDCEKVKISFKVEKLIAENFNLKIDAKKQFLNENMFKGREIASTGESKHIDD